MVESNPEAFDPLHIAELIQNSRGALEGNNLGAIPDEQPSTQFSSVSGDDPEMAAKRIRLYEAAVLYSYNALDLISELSLGVVISRAELEQRGVTLDLVVATGMLTQAHLCTVDERGIRITPRGISFVEEFSSPKDSSSYISQL